MVELRTASLADEPAIVELVNRNQPWRPYPLTIDALRHGHATVPPDRPDIEVVATDGLRLIGWGWLRDLGWPIGALSMSLDVAQDRRREGVGTRLLAALSTPALGMADEIATRVAEESESGVAFARSQRFVERYRLYEFVLDLEGDGDPGPPSTHLEGTQVELTTLSARASQELRRGAYRLFVETVADVPTPDPVPAMSYERWEAEVFGHSAGEEVIVLATHYQHPVALCHLSVSGKVAWNVYTCVSEAYRRTGLALAVKREGIRLARQRAVRFIRTENDTLNLGMIAINERLGFRRRPGRIRFGRPL